MLQFEFVTAIIGGIALVVLYLAYRLLASSGWVMGWIQGNLGLGLLLVTCALVLAIVDIRSYHPMFDDIPIATISLHTLDSGKHQLRLVNNKGIEESYSFSGNQYRFAINQLRWETRFAGAGMGHGYRVRSLIACQDGGNLNEVTIAHSNYLDIWQLFHHYLPDGLLVSAHLIETQSKEVVDGGMYELIPQAFDILVIPLNQVAKQAEIDSKNKPQLQMPVSSQTEMSVIIEKSDGDPMSEEPVSMATQGSIIRTPPLKATIDEEAKMPGAHIQATPANVVEKTSEP